jgi:GH24 family phage-related lysozyme (muramidase)
MYKNAALKYREALEKGGSGVQLTSLSRQDIKQASSRSGLGKRVDTNLPQKEESPDMETMLMQRMADAHQRVQDAPTTRERFMAMVEEQNLDADTVEEALEAVTGSETQGTGLGSRPSTETTPAPSSATDFIMSFENKPQESYTAYWDEKQWSIGFGTKAKSKNEVITYEEALSRVNESVEKARTDVLDVAEKYGYNWNEDQITALTSFTFNLGRSNLVKLTDNGTRGDEEISNMILEYNKAGGKVLDGLTKRRQAESNLFSSVD